MLSWALWGACTGDDCRVCEPAASSLNPWSLCVGLGPQPINGDRNGNGQPSRTQHQAEHPLDQACLEGVEVGA